MILFHACSEDFLESFHHGAPSDYDEWAEYQKGQEGAQGWSYKEFSRYVGMLEKFRRNYMSLVQLLPQIRAIPPKQEKLSR